MDRLRVSQLASRDVLEPLVAVEPALVGTELRDPWPYGVDCFIDLDPVSPAPRRIRHEIVAGIRAIRELRIEAPVTALGSVEWREECRGHDRGARCARDDVAPVVAR